MMRWLGPLEKSLPEQAYVELVRSLFALPLPSLIMSTLFVGVALLAIDVTDDPLLLVLAVAGTAATVLRLSVVVGYRRRDVEREVHDAASATLAERRFAIPYLTFAAFLGLFGGRALALGHVGLHMIVAALLVGYAAGAAAAVSLRPKICSASMIVAVVPAALVGLASGGPFHASLAIVLLALLAGGLQSVIARYRGEVDKIELRRKLAGLARRDPLTGLLNRLGLAEHFDAAAASAARGQLIAIHCLDLDEFKAVNDRHGHLAGDALLRLCADRLGQNLRAGDIACRLGGDEFVVLQCGARNEGEAEALAHRLVQRLGAPYQVGERPIKVGVSIGYAVGNGETPLDRLLARADNALYAIKAIGGGSAAHSERRIDKATVSMR